jgi:hypothetical protein
MKQDKNSLNEAQIPAQLIPTGPDAPAGLANPAQIPATNSLPTPAPSPSSSVSYRLTQYLAIRSTMYCKVPVQRIIFVMQAGWKTKKETSQQDLSKL